MHTVGRVKNTYRHVFPLATPKLSAFEYVKVEFNEKEKKKIPHTGDKASLDRCG